ncbi:hypothetical protein [Asanoa siamensis]|uniref:LPXTG-motif cell wall-anchored protein n=1 Tax=Asanoa siamensis TaxID=926357 RepID=A0ABQ4CM69_9ACTN|nr:hypothetical protein [Asanoa siamensis]GIF72391.1 hypothetical protein Asi02nite_19090 [Asanoa siamensis]
MSKRFVGKVLASVALGGATLLIAPGIALASDPGGDWTKGHDDKACAASEWQGKEDKKEAPHGAPVKEEAAKKDGDKECGPPKGWVDGGAGGGTDATLATTGGALVGAAALGGLVLLRRRRTDGSVA